VSEQGYQGCMSGGVCGSPKRQGWTDGYTGVQAHGVEVDVDVEWVMIVKATTLPSCMEAINVLGVRKFW
jgi:hypothetical protein